MGDGELKTRVVSVIAATIISLACGTNYAYSAWGPQFAERMQLSSTQSNLIGTFANLGMYIGGIPVGLLVDSKGPKPGVLFGGCSLSVGYFAVHRAFENGPGSVALPWLCFFAFMTGIGGAAAFAGSVKTSALNWPDRRGTATAFPLSAFGLGAFFFSLISSLAFPDNTSSFLLLLSIGCLSMCYVSVIFLRVVHQTAAYTAISTGGRRDSSPLHRTKSKDSRHGSGSFSQEPGRQDIVPHDSAFPSPKVNEDHRLLDAQETHGAEPDENSSLLSKSSSSGPGDLQPLEEAAKADRSHDSRHIDIRGFALLQETQFYRLWLLLGILTGTGLMTINNIGNDASPSAKALWTHFDDSASHSFIQERQMRNVMLLSVLSCVGRLCSGIGSDLIVKHLHGSRYWCLFMSASIFCIAQLCGARIENPHLLGFVSGITGLAYGFLFGVYPSLVAATFGIRGLSQNWGCMTLSPILFGNIFNITYGRIYDYHSYIRDGQRICLEGLDCYGSAYWVTFGASLVGVGISLWSIRYDHIKQAEARKSENEWIRGA